MDNIQIFYIVLAVLTWILGYFHTGKFVRPRWKQYGKFVFYITVSTLLVIYVKHYSLIFIVGHQLLGLIFHIRVCKHHKINWITCEPRSVYLKLHEQWGKGNFNNNESL